MRKYIIFTVILPLVISIGYLLYIKFERPFPKLSMNEINEITVISYWPGADGKSQEIKVGQSVKEKIIREFNTLIRSDITAVIGTPEYYIDIVLKEWG